MYHGNADERQGGELHMVKKEELGTAKSWQVLVWMAAAFSPLSLPCVFLHLVSTLYIVVPA